MEIKETPYFKDVRSLMLDFLEVLEEKYSLKIDWERGEILEQEQDEIFKKGNLIFRLNHETLTVKNIYFDDLKMIVRDTSNRRLRTVNIKTIQYIEFRGERMLING